MPTNITGATGVDKVQDNAVNPLTDIASGIPCFSAKPSTTQAISNPAKINFGIEDFDTTNAFDTALSRFTPLAYGYYQVNCAVGLNTATADCGIALYKNGTLYKVLFRDGFTDSGGTVACSSIIVYLNGTTDYIELYYYTGGANTINTVTYFQAHLIVGA